jgi:uncharacterized membrane protein YfcA
MLANLISDILQLDFQSLLPIVLIIALAGFVSGLSGFGFSAVGVAVLWVMPPTRAIPLLMALSIANQLLSIAQLKKDMLPLKQWWTDGPASYIAGGLLGVPIGIWIMANLPAAELTFVTGLILLTYAAWMIFKPHTKFIQRSGTIEHLVVGMIGGTIGGFTAFPGCAVVIWAGLRNLSKHEQRSIVQPYILAMQFASLFGMIFFRSGDLTSNPFDESFWLMFAMLLPIVLPMTNLGVKAFKRLSDVNFRNITLGVLAFSGTGLVYKSFATVLLFFTASSLLKY